MKPAWQRALAWLRLARFGKHYPTSAVYTDTAQALIAFELHVCKKHQFSATQLMELRSHGLNI
jgi:hypothetical protein